MNCSIQPSLALRRCLVRASAASFVQPFAQRCVMVGITVGVACTSGHSMQSGGQRSRQESSFLVTFPLP